VDQDDANELMRHILQRLQEAGMGELVANVTEAIGESDARPSEHLQQMLASLDADIRAHAVETTERIMVGFQEVVRTVNGAPPRDLRLDLTGAHRAVFDRSSVPLAEARLGDVLRALEQLREGIRRDFQQGDYA
jgi:hypothetical protein